MNRVLDENEKYIDCRYIALQYTATYMELRLNFSVGDFLFWFSEETDMSEKTIWRYYRGETPMKRWTFEQYWNFVENIVQKYIDNDGATVPPPPCATEIWAKGKVDLEKTCRVCFINPYDLSRLADLPIELQKVIEVMDAHMRKCLEDIKPRLDMMGQKTLYSLLRNFPALVSVTMDDNMFLTKLLTMKPKEKESLKAAMLQGATVDAGTMLANLKCEEVRCWVDFKSTDYGDTSRKAKGIWESFSEKFMDLSIAHYPAVTMFLIMLPEMSYNCKASTTKKMPDDSATYDDLDLLLLFKYCLAPEEQKRLLS